MPKLNYVSLIAPEIKEILGLPNKAEELKKAFADLHPRDIFLLCSNLEPQENAEIVMALDRPLGIEFFQEFRIRERKEIFRSFSREWMARVLEEMASDERADFIKALPKERTEEILPLIAQAERNDIKKLIQYAEGTAGSILTTDYASLPPEITVKEAMEKLKFQAFDRETIYYIYIVDNERKLIGIVSLRTLIVSPSFKRIDEVMQKNVISAQVDEDKEAVAKKLSDYDMLAIPVVEGDNRLVGIVTVDDVVDVVNEEATEDFYKYAAAGDYLDYLKAGVFQMAKQRTMWLLILIFVGFITGLVIASHSSQIQTLIALSFFMPMILGSGGNAGTQSSTVVIRGLATGNIDIKDILKVFRKELAIGIMIGSIMAVLAYFGAMWIGGDPNIGITVGLSMICSVVIATMLGALLPIMFKKMKLDPALMSGPFITSIVDISSLFIYFRIADVILF